MYYLIGGNGLDYLSLFPINCMRSNSSWAPLEIMTFESIPTDTVALNKMKTVSPVHTPAENTYIVVYQYVAHSIWTWKPRVESNYV